MRKAIFIFVIAGIVLAGVTAWFFLGEFEIFWQEAGMIFGLVMVISFAVALGIRRIRSIRKNQPPEDELSKVVLKRASSTAYYVSLYSWLALMILSDTLEMDVSTLIGMGIMRHSRATGNHWRI